jgi:hypothetical protein
LSSDKQHDIQNVVADFNEIFWLPGDPLGFSDVITHTIPTGDSPPVASRPRRYSPQDCDQIDKEVQRLIDIGVVAPCNSPWASPIVLVQQKGKTRMCIDYRRVNSLTAGQHWPLPNIEDCVNALHGAKYFSTIDLKSGYHQMGLSDDDKDKTAFITRSGQYRFERGTPFGLMGAPSSFQRLMSAVLADLQWESAIAYLDDVIVHGKTWSDHIHKLRTVCQRFQNHNLVLNPEKCQFGHQEVDFLGMHISSDGIRPNSEKISAIQLLPSPSSLKELRGALGSLSYFRRFIPNFADTAKPLYRLLEKQVDHRQFVWSSKCETAFQQLKQCLWDRRIPCLFPKQRGGKRSKTTLRKILTIHHMPRENVINKLKWLGVA